MITNAILTSTPVSIIAGTANQNQAVTCIHLCNITPEMASSASPQTASVNIYVMPNGGNVSTMQYYKIYNEVPIDSTDTLLIDTEKLVLGNGDAIWASCTVDGGIAMTVSSVGM